MDRPKSEISASRAGLPKRIIDPNAPNYREMADLVCLSATGRLKTIWAKSIIFWLAKPSFGPDRQIECQGHPADRTMLLFRAYKP